MIESLPRSLMQSMCSGANHPYFSPPLNLVPADYPHPPSKVKFGADYPDLSLPTAPSPAEDRMSDKVVIKERYENEDNPNTQFDDPSNDLDNNTILVSSEYEKINMFVEVEHSEDDDDDEGVKGQEEETEVDVEKDDDNESDDPEDESDENEFAYFCIVMVKYKTTVGYRARLSGVGKFTTQPLIPPPQSSPPAMRPPMPPQLSIPSMSTPMSIPTATLFNSEETPPTLTIAIGISNSISQSRVQWPNSEMLQRLVTFSEYGDDPSSQLKFDSVAWSEAIGRLQTTRTQVYKFSTRMQPASLFAPATTFKSACGLMPYVAAA
ncbi:Uncharacterized protein TCM_010363 [Theobroma cacao]|uniref:Uncharacterized protein n=1 Tax=Theobroma cacao TaxID=3641 RepID=A0A061E753_THECC|nr:Uncharacterized protein TCM_010363 [Theobroma cacao]